MKKENETNKKGEDVEIVEDQEGTQSEVQFREEKLKAELERCEKEKKEYLDGWQRTKADCINYKKDEAKRFQELSQFATQELILNFLPVLDSFELALQSGKKDNEQGFVLIRSQFKDTLVRHGLAEIPVKAGDTFRPEVHESMGEVESGLPQGVIAEILQKGYTLYGRVLRPARVKLSKHQT